MNFSPMTPKRWLELMDGCCVDDPTAAERLEGWHFCWEWDGLLINPTMGEWNACACFPSHERQAIEDRAWAVLGWKRHPSGNGVNWRHTSGLIWPTPLPADELARLTTK